MAVQEPNKKPYEFCDTHKWTKRSIFWELPYWKDLLIRHNIDVMHTEKNVFDNIFNTVMDFKGKTKDGLASRKDMTIWCDRPELSVDLEYQGNTISKAVYQVTEAQKESILQWLVSLKFPDGYCSNLSRCVDMNKLTTTLSMKTHDAHVIMQRLLPIARKEMLPEHVWSCITEINLLFQSICSSVLDATSFRRLEESVPMLMCHLEKIMPPSFFNGMEHLVIHLPYETLNGGSVFYRWMYRFERLVTISFIFEYLFHNNINLFTTFILHCRFLGELKKKVTNKAHVETSICQVYLQQEISTFSSFCFEREVITRRKRSARNDDIGEDLYKNVVSIFNYPGRGKGVATN
ncbi:unnamed protein product [Cuscuta europaea]|uniref:DUF4218 domain-containing protein n=1 Tax=Cuscuta europaea TaxID=41803 RepID=A0A9P0VS53_CUSEU|nr:unnamed protein product [Cuscuta europaea]